MTPREIASGGRREVALFGTFDTENFGDCLFPLIAKQQLSQRIEIVDLRLFSPTSRTPKIANYTNVHAIERVDGLFDEVMPAFVVGGGALLATEHILFAYPQIRFTYPYSLKCWLLPAMIARAWHCPLILNAVGFGPFDSRYSGFAERYLADAALCGVRDEITRAFLSELNVSAEIVPDCGLLTPELLSPSEWSGRYAALSAEFSLPEHYIAVQASLYLGAQLDGFASAVADAAAQAGRPVVLVPICHHLNDRVAAGLMEGAFLRRGVQTVRIGRMVDTLDTAALLSRAALYVGSSLHGALVTMAFGKPALSFSLASMPKNRAVLATVGAESGAVSEASRLSRLIHERLDAPGASQIFVLDRVRERLRDFFDRMGEVIVSRSGAPLARPLRFAVPPGGEAADEIRNDLDHVKALSIDYRRSIPLARRCGAVLVRNNRLASEWYDRLTHSVAVRKANGKP